MLKLMQVLDLTCHLGEVDFDPCSCSVAWSRYHHRMALPFVVVVGKGSLVNVAGTFALQDNLSIFELFTKIFLKTKHCSKVCPFRRRYRQKVGPSPRLEWVLD